MDKQITAVEWLIDTMINSQGMSQTEIDKVFQQAKQMEREQIEDIVDIKKLNLLLFDCYQTLTRFSNYEDWSEWNESVRKRLADVYIKRDYFTKTYQNGENS